MVVFQGLGFPQQAGCLHLQVSLHIYHYSSCQEVLCSVPLNQHYSLEGKKNGEKNTPAGGWLCIQVLWTKERPSCLYRTEEQWNNFSRNSPTGLRDPCERWSYRWSALKKNYTCACTDVHTSNEESLVSTHGKAAPLSGM